MTNGDAKPDTPGKGESDRFACSSRLRGGGGGGGGLFNAAAFESPFSVSDDELVLTVLVPKYDTATDDPGLKLELKGTRTGAVDSFM